jgi:hypothetical protein
MGTIKEFKQVRFLCACAPFLAINSDGRMKPAPPLPSNVFFKIMNRCLWLGGEIPSVTSAKTSFILKQQRLEPEVSSIQTGIKLCLSIRIALLTLHNDLHRHSTGMNGNRR